MDDNRTESETTPSLALTIHQLIRQWRDVGNGRRHAVDGDLLDDLEAAWGALSPDVRALLA